MSTDTILSAFEANIPLLFVGAAIAVLVLLALVGLWHDVREHKSELKRIRGGK